MSNLSRRSLLASAAFLPFAPHATVSPSWVECAPLTRARSEAPAVAYHGHIYSAGGFTAGTATQRYDPERDDWEEIGNLPERVNHAGMSVWQEQVVLCGGYSDDATTPFDSILGWDVENGAWRQIGTLPEPIGAFGLATIDGALYLAGGATDHLGGPASNRVWMRASGDTGWTSCPPLSVAREHLALIALDGTLVAIGGRATGSDEQVVGAAVEVWDRSSNFWTRGPDLVEPRSGLAGCAIGTSASVAGGETSGAIFDNVNVFDGARWNQLPPLPIPVHGLGLAAIDGSLFAVGGSTVSGQIASVANVYRLDVAQATDRQVRNN